MEEEAPFDPVEVGGSGETLMALEGAVASPSGALLLLGWALDPQVDDRAMFAEVAGERRPVEILGRFPRHDVLKLFRSQVRSRTADLGFVALAFLDPDALHGGQKTLGLGWADNPAAGTLSNNRILFEPGSGLYGLLLRHLPLRTLKPAALERIVQAVLNPEDARAAEASRWARRVEVYGPERYPELSLVVPLLDNFGVLKHTLAYLAMSGEADRVELVLAAARSWMLPEIKHLVTNVGFGLTVRVISSDDMSLGGAARLGVESATAERVLLASSDVLPPATPWVGRLLEQMPDEAFCVARALPRFDGAIQRFGVQPLDDGDLVWSHEAVRSATERLMSERGLDRISPGLVAGRRTALLAPERRWGGYFVSDYFWVDLMAQAAEGACAEPLDVFGEFVRAPTTEGHLGPPDQRLLDAYRLYDALQAGPTAFAQEAA